MKTQTTYRNGSREPLAEKITRLENRIAALLSDLNAKPSKPGPAQAPRPLNVAVPDPMGRFLNTVARPTAEAKTSVPGDPMSRFIKNYVTEPRSGQ